MRKKIIKWWNKHFVQTKFIQSLIIVPFVRDGKKCLCMIRINNGVEERRYFLVEHLVNENLEVTDETLKQEKEYFAKLL